MLHELLLVLSAHESSIFKPWPPPPAAAETIILDPTFHDIHPSERAALNNLAHLSFLHKTLRHSLSNLVHSHPSIVVRAIVSSVRDKVHGFQDAVEEIERMILTRDDSVVGAFDIVPLARLSTLLGEWDRVLHYLHKLVSGITAETTGAKVVDQLHRDQHTGYPDIAAIVVKLIAAGEEAWLRQVSSWILYGRIPQLGYSDFFIHPSTDPNISPLDENAFTIEWPLWPTHLPRDTASSILFIGRALARIQMQSPTHQISTQQILKSHLHILNTITFPLSPQFLTKSITAIRLSLSSSVLSNLLPLDTIVHLVKRFRQDFLLGHGSLMITLLSTADDYLVRRTEHDGGTIKEVDVNNLLTKAWSIVSRLENTDDDDQHDQNGQSYERSLKLSLVKGSPDDQLQFDEFLLRERIQLKYEITWPLDLFLSRADIILYNRIFTFLLAMKRCQGRLTSLWPGRNYPNVKRTTWSTITYALFLIDSLWSYFQVYP
jgi:gamma-tubulin complex component 4